MYLLFLLIPYLQTTNFPHDNFQHAPITQSFQDRSRIPDLLHELHFRQTLHLMLVTVINPIAQHLVLSLCTLQRIENILQLSIRELSFPAYPTFKFRFKQIVYRLLYPDNLFLQQGSNSHVHILPFQQLLNLCHANLSPFLKNLHDLPFLRA